MEFCISVNTNTALYEDNATAYVVLVSEISEISEKKDKKILCMWSIKNQLIQSLLSLLIYLDMVDRVECCWDVWSGLRMNKPQHSCRNHPDTPPPEVERDWDILQTKYFFILHLGAKTSSKRLSDGTLLSKITITGWWTHQCVWSGRLWHLPIHNGYTAVALSCIE